MRRAVFLLVFLLLFAPSLAAPASAQCGTPVPTWTPTPTYQSIVLGTQSAHLIAYFPLTETSGTTASELSGISGDGTYSGATLAADTFLNGDPAPTFDGINDYVEIYSVALGTAWDTNSYTVAVWFKTTAWSDTNFRGIVSLRYSTNYLSQIRKSSVPNTLSFNYPGVGTEITYSYSSSAWSFATTTRDVTANVQKSYVNASEIDSRAASSNANALTLANIGRHASAFGYWSGSIAHVAIWDVALDSTEISALYNVPSAPLPTPTIQPTCTVVPGATDTPTITPTADVYSIWTMVPPATTGTPQPGQPVAMKREFTMGGVVNAVLLFALFVTALIILTIALLRKRNT